MAQKVKNAGRKNGPRQWDDTLFEEYERRTTGLELRQRVHWQPYSIWSRERAVERALDWTDFGA